MSVIFRPATIEDKAQLLSIYSNRQDEVNLIRGDEGNVVMTEGGSVFDEMIADPKTIIIIGLEDQSIVATSTIYFLSRIRNGGEFALIEDVLVVPEKRGLGIGKLLMQSTIDYCKANPLVKKIKLGTGKENERLHAFYESFGFVFNERFYKLNV